MKLTEDMEFRFFGLHKQFVFQEIVTQIHKAAENIPKDIFYQDLEHYWSVGLAETHYQVFKVTKEVVEAGLPLVRQGAEMQVGCNVPADVDRQGK